MKLCFNENRTLLEKDGRFYPVNLYREVEYFLKNMGAPLPVSPDPDQKFPEIFRNLKGIEISFISIPKNGRLMKGIRAELGSGPCPVAYYSEDEPLIAVLTGLNNAVEAASAYSTDVLKDRDYVLSHLFLTLQRPTEDGAVKMPYLNLEAVLRVMVPAQNQFASAKVPEAALKALGIDPLEAWKSACRYTRETVMIKPMIEVMGELGAPVDGVEIPAENPGISVATNRDKYNGAIALLYPDLFRDFCIKYKTEKLLLLPSSINEILVLSDPSLFDEDNLLELVRTVNSEQVKEEEQLEPAVYQYDLERNQIMMVK